MSPLQASASGTVGQACAHLNWIVRSSDELYMVWCPDCKHPLYMHDAINLSMKYFKERFKEMGLEQSRTNDHIHERLDRLEANQTKLIGLFEKITIILEGQKDVLDYIKVVLKQ